MFWFKKTAELLRDKKAKVGHYLQGQYIRPSSDAEREHFLNMMEKAELLYLSDAYLSGATPDHDVRHELKAYSLSEDSPFPVFWVEFADPAGGASGKENSATQCRGSLVCELAPKTIFVLTIASTITEDGVLYAELGWRATDFDQLASLAIQGMNQEAVGSEKVHERVKLDFNGKNAEKRIKRILHIVPKKTQASYSPGLGRKIDFSHRFMVRGHWRAQPGKLGKNRQGEYVVHGYTWVTEHERGPDHAPLVKKSRVIHTEKEEPANG